MSTVKIIKNAIVNVNGREYTKGMVISSVSDELAAHLVEQAQVAELIEAAELPEKTGKSKPKKSADPDPTATDPPEDPKAGEAEQ
jgi:hypothetical protein